jgi:competence protein ComEA
MLPVPPLASRAEASNVARSERITIAAGGGALILALAAAWLAMAPIDDSSQGLAAGAITLPTPVASAPVASDAAETGTIVVDVQGAVVEPGVRQLPAGSRVADAIAAAGGYASDADLSAASGAINLAQPLGDGEQIRVPRIGDSLVAGGGPSSSGSPAAGAMVDLNTATPEELEALPGIGPVTVQKIVAARQQQPFASLDDAVQRGVINRGQLEDIQGVATAG